MKKLLSITLILIISTGFFAGCKKDKGNPPDLPPVESMTIDFSNFTSGKKSVDLTYNQKGTADGSYQFAALVAGVWKLIINTTLIVPVSAFKLAVNQNPSYLDTKTWQWSYDVTVAGVQYKARLTGQIGASDVVWKMYVTNTAAGGFTDFVWFDGTSKLDGTGGQWTIYQSPSSPVAMLQIDWTKTSSSIGTIKYSYIKNGDAFKASTIEYGLTTGTFDAYYNIHYYNNVKFSDVNVEWNTTSHNGRVKSSDFLDGTWFCWDSNKANSVCQ
jgi:hypothetical protein